MLSTVPQLIIAKMVQNLKTHKVYLLKKPQAPHKVMLQTQVYDGFVACAQRNLNSDLEEQQDFMLEIDK